MLPQVQGVEDHIVTGRPPGGATATGTTGGLVMIGLIGQETTGPGGETNGVGNKVVG